MNSASHRIFSSFTPISSKFNPISPGLHVNFKRLETFRSCDELAWTLYVYCRLFMFCLSNAMHSIGQSIKPPLCPCVRHFLSYFSSTFPFPSPYSFPLSILFSFPFLLFSFPFAFLFSFPYSFSLFFHFPFPLPSPITFPFTFSFLSIPFLLPPFPFQFPPPSLYLPFLFHRKE